MITDENANEMRDVLIKMSSLLKEITTLAKIAKSPDSIIISCKTAGFSISQSDTLRISLVNDCVESLLDHCKKELQDLQIPTLTY